MIIITEKENGRYPTIWHHLTEYRQQKYLEMLYENISRQMETKRYYKMRFQNIVLPIIRKEDVLSEMEKTLLEQPKIFAQDMNFLAQ